VLVQFPVRMVTSCPVIRHLLLNLQNFKLRNLLG
jgi:hypothetical protein